MKRRELLRALPAAALAMAGATTLIAAARPRIVHLTAKRFVFTPNEIRLAKGQPVVIEAVTQDVFMGLNLPDFNVRADLVPGKKAQLAFTPEKEGTFTFVCDVFCGDGHEAMSGIVRVA